VIRSRAEQLRALEEERFDVFAGEVYAKGFLRSYAIELGLDHEELLDVFRAGCRPPTRSRLDAGDRIGATGPRRSTPPAWLTWLFIGVLIVMGLGFLGMISSRFAPDTASPDEPQGAPPAPGGPGRGGPGDGPPEPGAGTGARVRGLEILVALEEASWLRVTVDGAVMFEGIAAAGETLQYQAETRSRCGSATPAGVRIQRNGVDLGAPGLAGPGRRGDATTLDDPDAA
jgi:cytoskeleton protein RodZ